MSAGPSTIPPTQAPSTVEYGGDEISALVLDPGQHWTRGGFAGEDTPKSVIPSSYGVLGDSHFFGDSDIHAARPGMEIKNPMSDGVVEDWDIAPHLWRHCLTHRLAPDLPEHPLLMTEHIWNPQKNREKTIELAFESFSVPAFYLAKSSVCAAFATGKSTALVIDVGASNVSITSVHDGFVLRRGSTHVPLGGDFVSSQIRAYLASQNVGITPHYRVVAKTPVEVGKPAEATLRDVTGVSESWKSLQEDRVLTEFKECTAQVWTGPAPLPPPNSEAVIPQIPGRTFEFPDGYNLVFGPERYRLTEGIFNPRSSLTASPDPDSTPGLAAAIAAALRDVDIEIKGLLLSNVVVCGAGSLLYGFTDRLHNELAALFPGPRIRIVAAGNSTERRYAGWLGGSVLASLGSFHQLWISKREYEEHGPIIVEKRCK